MDDRLQVPIPESLRRLRRDLETEDDPVRQEALAHLLAEARLDLATPRFDGKASSLKDFS